MVIITSPLEVNKALGTNYGYTSCSNLLRFTRQYFRLTKTSKVADVQIRFWMLRVGGNTNTPQLAMPPDTYPPDAPLSLQALS